MADELAIPRPKPTQLTGPVPNQGADPLEDYSIPSPGGRDPLANYAVGPTAPAQTAVPDQQVPQIDAEMSTQPEPTGLSSAYEQLREIGARFSNSFAVTDNESVQLLKEQYKNLFDDVRVGADGILVKRRGRQGWEKLDRDKLELIGDAMDFGRDVVEGLIENSGRIAGGASGFLAGSGKGVAVGAPAGPLGATAGGIIGGGAGFGAGAAIGGGTGAVIAKNAGDFIAEHWVGIKQDPSRDKSLESAQAAAFGAGFTWLGSKLARRESRIAADRADARKTYDFAKQKIAETTEMLKEVRDSGIKLGDDGRLHLDPQQIMGAGNHPELDVMARELSTQEGFRSFRRTVSEKVVDTFDSVARTLGAQSGRGAQLGDDFVLTAQDVRNLEGKLIGQFRLQAADQLRGAKGALPRTVMTVQMAVQNGLHKNEKAVQAQLGLTPAQARLYQMELNKFVTGINSTQGTMSLDGAFAKEAALTKQINAHMRSSAGKPYAYALMDLRNAVRDDALDMMEQSFQQMGDKNGVLLKQFQAAKARYSDIMGATNGLGKMLEQDNLSRNEVIGKLFEGKGSYKQAMNAKTLIQETNPKLWDQMTGEYLSKLRIDATDPKTNKVNWGQMAVKWRNLDERLQQEILNGAGIKREGMAALINIGTKLQNADFDYMARETKHGFIGSAVKGLLVMFGGGGTTAKGTVAKEMIESMGKDQSVMTWLKDGGLEDVLKQMPGMEGGKKAAIRDWVANWQPRTKKISAGTVETGFRGSRTGVRRDLEDKKK